MTTAFRHASSDSSIRRVWNRQAARATHACGSAELNCARRLNSTKASSRRPWVWRADAATDSGSG